MNVFLNGLRGSGKSTVGSLLGARLDAPFVDLDQRVLARFTEPSIHAAWLAHGEQAWRSAEVAALADVLRDRSQVIALGGGTAMIPAAADCIRIERSAGRAVVVYVRCDAPVLVQRRKLDPGDRPPLVEGTLEEEVAALQHQRDPAYRELADLIVDVTTEPSAATAERIATWIRSRA